MENTKGFLLLSIVIPVYDRQEGLNYLLSALSKSISSNKLESLVEIIVIDDFSKRSITLIESHLLISLERNDSNRGAPFSRGRGFQKSQGKFIHFHDSDDSICENWLEDIIKELKNHSQTDILLTGRIDIDETSKIERFQKFFNNKISHQGKIKSRLVYRNCLGPLGGVTFSRRVLEQVEFKNFSSCQDWQVYIDAIKHAKVLVSRPDIKFIFNKTGDDRISHNPRKKILGHLQLAKITGRKSVFGRNIRLFYLYTCKQHIYNKGGSILTLYKKNRLNIIVTFLVVSVYWRMT